MIVITSGIKQHEWHHSTPKMHRNDFPSHIELQADGDELGYIRSTFEGIPKCTNSVQVWTGEAARFIYNNYVC